MQNPESTLQNQWLGTGRRRYMSKAQRACDGCRARKSACQINIAPPCRMCLAHGQACEFTSRIRRRKSPMMGPSQASSTPLQPHSASPAGSHRRSFSEINQYASIEEQSPLIPGITGPLAGLDAGRIMEFSFSSAGDGNLEHQLQQPDHEIFDDLVLNLYNTERAVEISPNSRGIPRSLDNLPGLTAELCGLTGDMDPYVLQHYQFDANSEFAFSKLTIRQVQRPEMPVHFLLSRPEPKPEPRPEPDLHASPNPGNMDEIVPQAIGERLIKLYVII